jgi:hypothetical protein
LPLEKIPVNPHRLDAAVKALEQEIDTHVFRLYALTPAEIDLVKSTTAK